MYNYTGTTRLWRMRKYNTIISSQTSAEVWQKSTWAESTLLRPVPLQLNPCLQMAVSRLSHCECCPHACHWTPGVAWWAFSGGCLILRRQEAAGNICLFWCTRNTDLKISWKATQARRQQHLSSGAASKREREAGGTKAVMCQEGISSRSLRRKREKKIHQSCVPSGQDACRNALCTLETTQVCI